MVGVTACLAAMPVRSADESTRVGFIVDANRMPAQQGEHLCLPPGLSPVALRKGVSNVARRRSAARAGGLSRPACAMRIMLRESSPATPAIAAVEISGCHDPCPPGRAAVQRRAVRADAVPDGRRRDAGVRHHAGHQSRPRLVVHARRLFPDGRADLDAVLCARHSARLHRRRAGRGRARDRGLAAALPARSARPGAGDLRALAVLQRGGHGDLGPRVDPAQHPAVSHRLGRDHSGRRLSDLSARHHRRRDRGRAPALSAHHPHAGRRADPRRQRQPRDRGGARHQYQPALHAGVRAQRHAGGARRHHDGAAAVGRAGSRRPDPHSRRWWWW